MNNKQQQFNTLLKDENTIKLIKSICKQYVSLTHYNFDELYNLALVGLWKAIQNYDESSGVKFLTYAYKFINGEITSDMKQNMRFIKTPELVIREVYKVLEFQKTFEQENFREPTKDEIRQHFNHIPDAKFERVFIALNIHTEFDNQNESLDD